MSAPHGIHINGMTPSRRCRHTSIGGIAENDIASCLAGIDIHAMRLCHRTGHRALIGHIYCASCPFAVHMHPMTAACLTGHRVIIERTQRACRPFAIQIHGMGIRTGHPQCPKINQRSVVLR